MLPTTNHHLHLARYITPSGFPLKISVISSKSLTLTHPILRLPTLALNDTRFNSYSVSFEPLEIRPEPIVYMR